MGRSCCAPNCRSNYAVKDGFVPVFTFPSNPELRQKWINLVPRINWNCSRTSVLCIKHFRPEDIIDTIQYIDADGTVKSVPAGKNSLKKGALPSIWPEFPATPLAVNTNENFQKSSEDNVVIPSSTEFVRDAGTLADANQKMITVTCAEHHDMLVDGLWNLWRSKRSVDLFLHCGDRSFQTHQILVDMFFSVEQLGEISSNKTTADQIDLLESILEFMYSGTIRVAENHLDQLLDLARQVEFTMLVNCLQKFKRSQTLKNTGSPSDHLMKTVDKITSTGQTVSSSEIPTVVNLQQESIIASDPVAGNITNVLSDNTDISPEAASKDTKELAANRTTVGDVASNSPVRHCPKCEYKTTELQSYAKHVKTAHKVKPKRLNVGSTERRSVSGCSRSPRTIPVCQICVKIFRSRFDLAKHMRKHTGEKLFMCDLCGKKLTSKSSLQSHSLVHSGEKPYICPSCGKSFAHTTTLKRHELLHDSNPVCHPCNLCPLSFLRLDVLNEHIKQKHKDGYAATSRYKPANTRNPITSKRARGSNMSTCHSCNWCSRNFVRSTTLEAHVKLMHPDDYVAASNVPESQKPKPLAPIRRKVDATATYSCRLCVGVVGKRKVMERHRAAMHPGLKIFGCEQCDYRTSNIPMLVVHARLHTGERPFKCGMCPRTFRDGSNYRNHLKGHRPNNKPHRCISCGQTFSLRRNLKFHLKKVHLLTVGEVETALAGNLPAQQLVQENVNGAADVAITPITARLRRREMLSQC